MQSHSSAPAIARSSVTQFWCCDCERGFEDGVALANHLRNSRIHDPRTGGNGKKQRQQDSNSIQQEEDSRQTRCKECGKTFQHQHALKQHLASVRHKPLSNILCLADTKCKKRFNCPSGQLHHLESGKCVSRMTKTRLHAAIAVKDTGETITTGGTTVQWLLEDSPSETSTSQIRSPILTPTSTEIFDVYPFLASRTPASTLSTSTDIQYVLTRRPHTGRDPQTCPLCPLSRTRKFKPSALRQHLSSSVHAQVSAPLPSSVSDKISFHCPSPLMGEENKKAVKQFSTVSGLAQHLESGACGGGRETLRRVVEYVQKEMKDIGFGELKLLS
jgi:hypothetical protein